ncbi:hypothetical protein [Thiolapillus sp.]
MAAVWHWLFLGQFTGTEVGVGDTGKTRRVAPSVSALAAGRTENGTWFIGGGHHGVWRQDSIRYLGGAGYGSVKMDYYGQGDELGKQPVSFTSEALGLVQELQFRLGDSNFFAGAGYKLIDTQNSFDPSSLLPIPGLPAIEFDSRSAGVSLFLNHDSRDNMFTPSSGTDAELKLGVYGKTWGGDDDFSKYRLYIKHYRRLGDNWVLGLRGDLEGIDGDAPFYEYPFIDMRGIKVMRYQGKRTGLGEFELRWSFTPRWTLVGFAGAGKTVSVRGSKDSDLIYARGMGFRYLIASKLGLQMGMDIAKGPEDTAIYFQVGSSWLR